MILNTIMPKVTLYFVKDSKIYLVKRCKGLISVNTLGILSLKISVTMMSRQYKIIYAHGNALM